MKMIAMNVVMKMNYLNNNEIPKIHKSFYQNSMSINSLCINYQYATVHYYQKINQEQYLVSGQIRFIPEATSSGHLVSNEEFEKNYVIVKPVNRIKPSINESIFEEEMIEGEE